MCPIRNIESLNRSSDLIRPFYSKKLFNIIYIYITYICITYIYIYINTDIYLYSKTSQFENMQE